MWIKICISLTEFEFSFRPIESKLPYLFNKNSSRPIDLSMHIFYELDSIEAVCSKMTFLSLNLLINWQASKRVWASATIGSKHICLLEDAKIMEPLWFLMTNAFCATNLLKFASVLILIQFFGGGSTWKSSSCLQKWSWIVVFSSELELGYQFF